MGGTMTVQGPTGQILIFEIIDLYLLHRLHHSNLDFTSLHNYHQGPWLLMIVTVFLMVTCFCPFGIHYYFSINKVCDANTIISLFKNIIQTVRPFETF